MRTDWNDERVATLKRMYYEGYSASAIAKALGGVTRNAVIGKIHRLGLAGQRTACKAVRRNVPPRGQYLPPAKKTEKPSAVKRTAVQNEPLGIVVESQPTSIAEKLVVKGMKHLTLLEIKDGQCKFVSKTGKNGEHLFCGRKACGSYCPEHKNVVYPPRQKRDPSLRLPRSATAGSARTIYDYGPKELTDYFK